MPKRKDSIGDAASTRQLRSRTIPPKEAQMRSLLNLSEMEDANIHYAYLAHSLVLSKPVLYHHPARGKFPVCI